MSGTVKPLTVFLTPTESETFESFTDALTAEVDLINTCTHPSTPATFIDLPEINTLGLEFFYNFYTKDERTVETNDISLIDIASPDQSVEFEKRQQRAPRSVILSIRSPPIDPKLGGLVKGLGDEKGSVLIRDHSDKIVFEGAVANTRFSSLILKDNKVDETFYRELTGSISFDDAYAKSNTQSQFMSQLSRKFFSPLCETVQAPNQIKRALSNAQPRGVAYAPTDARLEAIAEALRDVNFVEFNMSISNAVSANVVMGALEDRGNIYQDELMSVEEDAKRIQKKYVHEARGYEILSSEYDLELAPIFTVTRDTNPHIDEASYPIGFYIEKAEISQDPSDPSVTITRDLEPIVVDKYGPLVIFDPNVKYGATYIYKVKIIYLVSYEANAVDPDGLTPDEIVFAISMIASEGVKGQVAAIERIPPPPPRNLSFNYNFADNCLDLFWEEPNNPQRDVMRYQVFRRNTVNDPYVLLGELDFDNSTSRVVPLEVAPKNKRYRVQGPRKTFKDINFKRSGRYIYALAAIDARGLTSGYSEQIQVTFNSYKNKIERVRISDPNAPKSYPNLYFKKDFFVDAMPSSDSSRMRVFFDPEYYDVVKTTFIDSASSGETENPIGPKKAGSRKPRRKIDTSLKLIGEKYKLQIINLDLQNSQVLEIDIDDTSGVVQQVPLGQAEIKTIL